jgi:23S rRNA (adenine2503-C2)-methyltransferase
MAKRIDLLNLTPDELTEQVVAWGQPAYRGGQIWGWLYRHLIQDVDEMGNLPRALRQRLADETFIGGLEAVHTALAEDGLTEKVVLRAPDGQLLEAVLMRYDERYTVCVSSQIGCAIGCPFCATGQAGWVRDLTVGEIIVQILYFARRLRNEGAAVSNVVFMGMGEPMANYEAVWRAIRILHDPAGLGLGARRFTLSTAGIVPGIERMAGEDLEVGLAISLHAPDDELRDRLVPLNRRYPLEPLMAAVREYIARTGRRVTFEYALAQEVNDTPDQARRTARLLHGLLCHVNLIPLNPTAGSGYEASSRDRVLRFQEILTRAGIPTTVRLRRGIEIAAGCGQLRGRYATQEREER